MASARAPSFARVGAVLALSSLCTTLLTLATSGCALIAGLEDAQPFPSDGSGGSGAQGVTSGSNTTSSAPTGGPTTGGPTTGTGGTGSCGYRSAVLADNPAAYWRLDEDTPPTCNDETGRHDGEYVGGANLREIGAIACDQNAAVAFDGVNQYVEFGDVFSFSGDEPFAVEAWIQTSGDGTIVSRASWDDQGNQYRGWHLVVASGDERVLLLRGDGVDFDGIEAPISENRFVHVVGQYDGNTLYLYVDGVPAASGASNIVIPAFDHPLQVGSSDWGAFEGSIDEVAIYEGVLSEDRIAAHHTAGVAQ